MRTEIHAALPSIGRDTWDALAIEGPLQQSYGYLRTVEVVPGVAARYVTVSDGSRLVGALPLYLPESVQGSPPPESSLLLQLPLGDEAPSEWRDAAVFAGAGHGFRSELLIAADLQECQRSDVRDRLLGAAQAERDSRGLCAVLYRHVTDRGAGQIGADVRLIEDAEAVIALPGKTWTEYVSGLDNRRRSVVRRDVSRFERAGLRLSTAGLTEHREQAAVLSAQVFARYGQADALVRRQRRYARVLEHMGDLRLVLLHSESHLIGFSTVVPWGEDLYVLDYGLDYERAGDHAEYFQLVFHEPIRLAYKWGLRRIHLGVSALHAKRLRGADILPLWTMVDGADCVPRPMVTAWNASIAERLGMVDRFTGSRKKCEGAS